jgi:hypothetical protein
LEKRLLIWDLYLPVGVAVADIDIDVELLVALSGVLESPAV